MGQLGLKSLDAEAAQIERKIIDDRARLEMLLGHLGPNHPEVLQLRQQIDNAMTYIATYNERVQQRMSTLSNERLAPVLISLLQEKLRRVQEHGRQLNEEFAIAEREAIQLNGELAELTVVNHETERLRKEHDMLMSRIAGIDLSGRSGDVRVSVVSPAIAKDSPVSPKLLLVALFSLAG